MIDLLRSVVAVLLVFGLVVFVHELGHFLAAKAVGVYAPRFSIGFGPALWSRKWGETEYVLAALPLGGYVRMASRVDPTMALIEGGGENQPASVGGSGAAAEIAPAAARGKYWDDNSVAPFGPLPVPANRLFESKSLPARLLIMFAGVTMNFLLGIVVLIGTVYHDGVVVLKTVQVGEVQAPASLPALADQIHPGDSIRAIDGQPVSNWNEIDERFRRDRGTPVRITTQRGDVSIPASGDGKETRLAIGRALAPYLPPVIDATIPGKPADVGGLRDGDSLVSVNGKPVVAWRDVVNVIRSSPGSNIELGVARGTQRLSLTIRPDSVRERNAETGVTETIGQIGALNRSPEGSLPISFPEAARAGWRQTWVFAGLVVETLKGLVTRDVSVKELSGPIGIARAASSAAKSGISSLFRLIALLSVNVALFNLLPIPILDGGQIMLNVIEAVKGSELSERTREYALRFGLAAIALLFVVVMYNELTQVLRQIFRL